MTATFTRDRALGERRYATTCRRPDCKRTRAPHRAFCESCLRALFVRVFGPSAAYPVRRAA